MMPLQMIQRRVPAAGLAALLLLFLSSVCVFGQELIDVVEMKNGNLYRGIIIENKLNEYIRIESLGGDTVYRLNYSDIDTMRRERRTTDGRSQGSTIIINQTQTQTANVTSESGSAVGAPAESSSPTGAVPPLSFENAVALKSQLGGRSYQSLRSVVVDSQLLASTNLYTRQTVFEDIRKRNWGWVLVGNLFVPGLGSLIQGDIAAGLYHLGSYVAYAVAVLPVINDPYFYDDPMSIYDRPEVVVTAVNLLVAGLVSLVSPATYQNKYNGLLKQKLQVP